MSSILTGRSWSPDEVKKITEVLDEGNRVLSDIAALREGLKDTVTAISEQYEIPKKALNKAIRVYHKGNMAENKDETNEVEELLTVTGKY